jgi:hypothetical protein
MMEASRKLVLISNLLRHKTGMREDPKTRFQRDEPIIYLLFTITSRNCSFNDINRIYIHGGRDLGNGALASLWSANLGSLKKI